MSEKNPGSFYYIIPAEVMHDSALNLFEKMIYALISGLTNKYGYCFASNDYFQEVLGIEIRKIQRHLQALDEKGYIRREIESDDKNPFKKNRKIFLTANFKKCLPDVTSDMSGDVTSDMSVVSPVTCVLSKANTLISKDKKSAAPPPSADASDLCKIFFESIKERNPKFKLPNLQKWASEFDSLVNHDNREVADVKALISWISTHSFWKVNIISPGSLRKNYDKLLMQMMADREKGAADGNRAFAMKMKSKYPVQTKNLTLNAKYAMNLSAGKEVPFDLPEETFRSAFCNMFGAKYEPNGQSGKPSEVDDTI